MKRFIKENTTKEYERNFSLDDDDGNNDQQETPEPKLFNLSDQEIVIMNERLKDLNLSFQKALSKCFSLDLPYSITSDDSQSLFQNTRLKTLLPSEEEAKSISCSIFTRGFFKLDEDSGAFVLDKSLIGEKTLEDYKSTPYGFISRAESSASTHYKGKNQMTNRKQLLHKDVDAYLEQESVMTGVEDKLMAPVLRSSSFSKTEKKEHEKLSSLLDPNYKSSAVVDTKDTAGAGWAHMAAPRMTPELKQELLAMKLKRASEGEGKRLKKEAVAEDFDEDNLPKYFQIGTIVDNAKEFYSDRVVKKKRQQSFLDELIQEDKETGYVSQRYSQIQDKLDQVQKRKKRKLMKKIAKMNKEKSTK
ncbi:hypothetical protein FDP41_011003 [Naegleria fowleri]|uniref:Fcf2 pre-rRNA processing C-terminal domain-containing protein n=1 Tax=Naegleria fowleri TaxID=5763 RepID=A0A6A5CCG9_NAEFO|nr:uncharacterized protein FDP41_011003 [Naegleria fowleri]KAF0983025.1 hypothetical protein FDP41_011003 [Naegleria fowleri]CAG4708402.1 unnamed protein product [Naegleria fowleri]